MSNLQIFLREVQSKVDAALPLYLSPVEGPAAEARKAALYSLTAGGKRLRPCLAIAAGRLLAVPDQKVLPFACALEMIHTYSLIHDDLPAMDDDDLRRGKPTCHRAFSEGTAILAGDALLTEAFGVMAREGRRQGIDPEITMTIIEEVAGAAGLSGMVSGQAADLAAEGKKIDLKELEAIHRLKTGALLEVSIRVGARLGEAKAKILASLSDYGRAVGLAFQIADDILDEEGDETRLGKTPGQDKKRLKGTYPSIIGLLESKHLAQRMVDQAIAAVSDFGPEADILRQLANYIVERNH